MRFSAVFIIIAAAGCFNPRIADGGFACDPTERSGCPEGQYCRNVSGRYVCTSSLSGTTPPTSIDMAMSIGGPGPDLAMATGGKNDMATGNVDMAIGNDMAMAGGCGVADLVINEVQSDGSSAADEWVEIYNPCAASVTLTAKLVYRSAQGAIDSTLATMTAKTIPAAGYFLVANAGYAGPADVKPFEGGGLAQSGGGVALRNSINNAVIDSMAWGSSTSDGYEQGTPVAAPATSKSVARTPNGANTHHDSVDFVVVSAPTPGAAN